MALLHELLAVEKDAKDVFSKILEETLKTFKQKSTHFLETRRIYNPFNEEDKDRPDEEFVPMVTTVPTKLSYAQKSFVRLMDIEIQKERANQSASADIVVELPDGKVETILEKAPVTFLVQMESVLERIRNLYQSIPTLDPAKVWVVDDVRENTWKSEPIERVRTKKIPKVIVKAPATDKFPAQTEIVTSDEPVGKWIQTFACGGLSPKQKSQVLSRIDSLIVGIKIARAKANAQEVKKAKIGNKLFNYINEGLKV
jgi:hypothetical protein